MVYSSVRIIEVFLKKDSISSNKTDFEKWSLSLQPVRYLYPVQRYL